MLSLASVENLKIDRVSLKLKDAKSHRININFNEGIKNHGFIVTSVYENIPANTEVSIYKLGTNKFINKNSSKYFQAHVITWGNLDSPKFNNLNKFINKNLNANLNVNYEITICIDDYE